MSYLERIPSRIARIRSDLPNLIELADRMAAALLAGGQLFTPQLGTYWPSEFGSRAGGLMGLKPPEYLAESKLDVAFTTLPDRARWKPKDDSRWQRLVESPAQIVIIGSPEEAEGAGPSSRFAGFTGGALPAEGECAFGPLKPLAPYRPFEQLVRGWLTAGEMIAACTRAGGRMPVMWMSVWLEGAFARNASFLQPSNLREPWFAPLFHESMYIPPIAPGRVSADFLHELEAIYARLLSQRGQIAQAGQWMAEAISEKKRVSTNLVGHSYPEILELERPDDYPLAWRHTRSDLREAHHPDLGTGDVALHLGYSPVDVNDVQRILDRGIRFIYTSPYGRPVALKDHPNLLWLDLPWRPGDATVDVPGYSVRILPMSSSAHTLLYFELLCDVAGRLGWS